ncbi:MAG TPA: 8-oxoguanine deaminase [Polyangia bacterium]|nr:8-oxoguanine deaminase [Polyangia bacterium]
MSRLWVHDAEVVVTMDGARREIPRGGVLVRGRTIEAVGDEAGVRAHLQAHPEPQGEVRRIDARGTVVLPGLVNGHHHLYQTLTRAVGTSRGLALFDWLRRLYPIWGRLTPEGARVSATIGLAELMLSGATTVADHLYLFPNGTRLDDTIEAARGLGVRFHPTRGAMSLGASAGGLPPDDLVEREDAVLADAERLIAAFHDPAPGSMLRLGLAPCSPFSVTPALMRETARLARCHPEVRLHTHLAETADETDFCLARFGMRPVAYAESLGWSGPDVWYAHMVFPDQAEIGRMARSGSGVCHCPSSNMILASGIAPVRGMRDAGVAVGLGVDGSASNDGNHLLGEARQAMLLQRVGWPGFVSSAARFSAREALELATLGGAAILGRDDIGALVPGRAADLVAFRVDGLEAAGALGDPVAALVTTSPARAWLSVIDGRVVVAEGQLLTADLPPLIERHNEISRAMLAGG